MVLVGRHELEEIFLIDDRDYPGYNEFFIHRKDLPEDFEVRTPTLQGISPFQLGFTEKEVEACLKPLVSEETEEEIECEMISDYKEKIPETPTKIDLTKNSYERFLSFCAVAASILVLIGGLFQIIISSQIPSEKKAPTMLVIPEGIPQEEPAPAGEKKVEVMPHNNYPQRDLNFGILKGKNDWCNSGRRMKIKGVIDTDIEFEEITSEHKVHKLFDLTDEVRVDERVDETIEIELEDLELRRKVA